MTIFVSQCPGSDIRTLSRRALRMSEPKGHQQLYGPNSDDPLKSCDSNTRKVPAGSDANVGIRPLNGGHGSYAVECVRPISRSPPPYGHYALLTLLCKSRRHRKS